MVYPSLVKGLQIKPPYKVESHTRTSFPIRPSRERVHVELRFLIDVVRRIRMELRFTYRFC